MAWAADDRMSGQDGVLIVDVGATPITVDLVEWNYREFYEWIQGRTAGNRGMGRTFIGTDFELNAVVRVRETGTTPIFFRRGASTAWSAATDPAATPALKITGNGAFTETAIRSRIGEYIEYNVQIKSNDADEANLPVITVA